MRNEDVGINEVLFTTKQMAETLNLTTRRVQQLAEEGILVREKRGKYRGIASLQKYIQYIQERDVPDDMDVDYWTEKARHEKAKREKTELQVAVMKGKLHRSEDVEAVMDGMVSAFRSRCLALPTKIAPQLLNKTEVAEVQEFLTQEVHDVLTDLATYDPAEFHNKNDEYIEVTDDEGDSE